MIFGSTVVSKNLGMLGCLVSDLWAIAHLCFNHKEIIEHIYCTEIVPRIYTILYKDVTDKVKHWRPFCISEYMYHELNGPIKNDIFIFEAEGFIDQWYLIYVFNCTCNLLLECSFTHAQMTLS